MDGPYEAKVFEAVWQDYFHSRNSHYFQVN